MISLLSHVGDGIVETVLVMMRCCCRVMLVMALLSFAGDGATEAMLVVV
jgi:hypothetical protein